MFALLSRYWWVLLLQGLLGIAVGVLTLLNPVITAVALLIYIAVWAIGMGVLQVAAAVTLRREISGEWWLALGGLQAFGALGIVLGPVTFAAAAAIVDVLRETEGGDRTNVSTHASVD